MTRHVVVVGAGNAALCAAIAARQAGCAVTVLERAPEAEHGGNSRFAGGTIRFAYPDSAAVRALVPDLTPEEAARTDFGRYDEQAFFADMARVTMDRTDPALCDALVSRSYDTMAWLAGHGVRFLPIWGRQSFREGDTTRFWGGLVLEAWGGGPGLVEAGRAACARRGIPIRHGTRAVRLLHDGFAVHGVVARGPERMEEIRADAVVIASGGFQADPEQRARYLGPGWELARVRGSRFNTGDGIRMALEVGAASAGHWSGCHAVGWDFGAPEFGDLDVGDAFQKHSYPLGIMVNATGRRFVDEGADLRLFTYARYGRIILGQPGGFAWQVFDATTTPLLRDEYRIKRVSRVRADTLPELAAKLEGVDAAAFLNEVADFNAAIRRDIPFVPHAKDGRGTTGLAIPKSNWANAIEAPPFEAYQVGCGISFTFGGLRINDQAQVMDQELRPIPGLFAAGEAAGGLFWFNYPAGSGLMAGAVFGRLAGQGAAGQR